MAAPVVIAYDGSELSRAAVREVAELFPARPVVVATVWEPGLAMAAAGPPDASGVGTPPADPAMMEAIGSSATMRRASLPKGPSWPARSGSPPSRKPCRTRSTWATR